MTLEPALALRSPLCGEQLYAQLFTAVHRCSSLFDTVHCFRSLLFTAAHLYSPLFTVVHLYEPCSQISISAVHSCSNRPHKPLPLKSSGQHPNRPHKPLPLKSSGQHPNRPHKPLPLKSSGQHPNEGFVLFPPSRQTYQGKLLLNDRKLELEMIEI